MKKITGKIKCYFNISRDIHDWYLKQALKETLKGNKTTKTSLYEKAITENYEKTKSKK